MNDTTTSSATTPDGLSAWNQRRHGTTHPNVSRPLTSARVVRHGDGSIDVHGDNGTSRLISATSDTPLRQAVSQVLDSVSDVEQTDRPAAPVIPAGSQVTVTIGRNVGTSPLDTLLWSAFQTDVSNRVGVALGATLVFGPFIGTGEWEGVTEESAVLVFISGPAIPVRAIDTQLKDIAGWYGQDAIAWTYGPNLLAQRPE